MLLNQRKENLLAARAAIDFQNVDELLQNVRAGTHAQLAGALHGAVLLPLIDAVRAEEFAAIVTLFGFPQDFEADAAKELVTEFLVHEAVLNSVEVVAAGVLVGL